MRRAASGERPSTCSPGVDTTSDSVSDEKRISRIGSAGEDGGIGCAGMGRAGVGMDSIPGGTAFLLPGGAAAAGAFGARGGVGGLGAAGGVGGFGWGSGCAGMGRLGVGMDSIPGAGAFGAGG